MRRAPAQSYSTAERALTERALKLHGVQDDLQDLVNVGCNRLELLATLDLAFLADETWDALVGMDLRQFKAVLSDIRNCALKMDRLYRSELIHRLSIEHRDPKFVRIHDIPTIPDQIRTFADAIEHYGNLLGPKRKIRGHTWKARIVAMVIEDTHKPHDPEVSGLIAAVLNNTKYSEKAHQEWRRKHPDFIRTASEIIRLKAMSKGLST